MIEAASTKPFGFLPHYPGPGLGGDCIPVVPHFLAWRLREYGYSAQLIEAAHEINAHMPQLRRVRRSATRSTTRACRSRARGSCCSGWPTRPNVHDTRESPSLEVMRQLFARGADVRYCDPWVAIIELDGVLHESVDWTAEEVRAADCVVVLTQHREFLEQPLWDQARLVVDTRNVVPPGPTVYSHLARCASLVLGAGYIGGERWPARRSSAATMSCSPTTGTRPTASSWSSLEAPVETADIRERDAVAPLLARGSTAWSSSPPRPAVRCRCPSPTTPRRRT